MKPTLTPTNPTTVLPATSWRPLFTGDEAAGFQAVIQDIAVALAPGVPLGGYHNDGFSLSEGGPGLAVHYAFLHRLSGNELYRQYALDYLEEAFAAAGRLKMQPRFYSGLPGLGWAGQLVQTALGLDEDLVEEIDEPLVAWAENDPPAGDYDLIRGMSGLGCYFLARMPRPMAARGLGVVVRYLADQAQERDDGLAWFTPSQVLGSEYRGISPEGHFDIGLAHGAAGAVALLGRIAQAGIEVPLATETILRALTWIAGRERSEGSLRFPSWIDPLEKQPRPSRLAWCYGDLGVAVGMFDAARRIGRADWQEQALVVARRAADVHGDGAKVLDAGICHGAAGAAHIFNRFHQATREPVFAAAARRWYRRTLELREVGQGFAGFRAFFPHVNPDEPWMPRPGLLTGAAGIGLALAAAVTDREPVWDRFLLTDIEPAPEPNTGETS